MSASASQLHPIFDAIKRLLVVASSDTGQSKVVADFLLAWWNADENGAFKLTDLWGLDESIARDCITVFTALATWCRHYPDALGFEPQFKALVEQWRPTTKRKARR